jgi:hypothetical protein
LNIRINQITSKIFSNSHNKSQKVEFNPVKELIPKPSHRKPSQRIASTTFCISFTTTTAKSTLTRLRTSNLKNWETFITQWTLLSLWSMLRMSNCWNCKHLWQPSFCSNNLRPKKTKNVVSSMKALPKLWCSH